MLRGRPNTMPQTSRASVILSNAAASIPNFLRLIVSKGVATLRITSDSATPLVTVPRLEIRDIAKSFGGRADEWARLITAYGVLGETTAASEVWLEAKEVFATSNAAMDILRTAATGAGVGP